MSSASLASQHVRSPSHALHPDRVRIAALSVALAVNLAVLLGALRPLAPGVLSPAPIPSSTAIHFIVPPAAVPPPPVLDVTPLPPTRAPAVPHRSVPLPMSPPTIVPTDEGNTAAPLPTSPAVTPVAPLPAAAAPVEATLAYRAAPLVFPPQAARQHMQGDVLLRVLVDEHGLPVQVLIDRSSGYALLDRSAREQVLAAWRFQPAVVQGRPVRAWARVPVKFALREL